MINKLSLIASTLGLTVVGAGVDTNTTTPLHITQHELNQAYAFETVEECRDKIQHLYELNPSIAGKLKCSKS